MGLRNSVVDVVVIGGGPAGAVIASRLALRGVSVTVLEKQRFPRFRLGESLLPQSLPVLSSIGVLDAVRERFLPKYGARFHDDRHGRKDRFSFADAWKADEVHAFQVPRDSFDALLLDRARALGVDVRERWTASKLLIDAHGRANGVEVDTPDEIRETVTARFVVDASGRDALTARAAGSTTKIAGLDQTAFFSHFEGVPRPSGQLEGDIDIVLFASSDSARPNWFWFIPFNDGRTSVGAVVSQRWVRDRRARIGTDEDLPSALFRAAVSESTTATELLTNATRLWPRIEATADFSYRVGAMSGPGWISIGDAGGFIDPLFSTGAHLAMSGASLGADAITAALSSPADEPKLLAAWESHVRSAAETFVLAVQAFYAGPLVTHLFADDKRDALRRSITSLLAGDVFGDAIWLRDTRLRLKQMITDATPASALGQ